MANPQVENGHIRIANELYDAILAHDFSKAEYKVLLCVIRKTYGWGKKNDAISISQFEQMAGIGSSRHIRRVVQALEKRNIISAVHVHGKPTVYELNKDYETWLTEDIQTQGVNVPRDMDVPRARDMDVPRDADVPRAQDMDVPRARDMDVPHNNQVQPIKTTTTPEVADEPNNEPKELTNAQLLDKLMPFQVGGGQRVALERLEATYGKVAVGNALVIALAQQEPVKNPLVFITRVLENGAAKNKGKVAPQALPSDCVLKRWRGVDYWLPKRIIDVMESTGDSSSIQAQIDDYLRRYPEAAVRQ